MEYFVIVHSLCIPYFLHLILVIIFPYFPMQHILLLLHIYFCCSTSFILAVLFIFFFLCFCFVWFSTVHVLNMRWKLSYAYIIQNTILNIYWNSMWMNIMVVLLLFHGKMLQKNLKAWIELDWTVQMKMRKKKPNMQQKNSRWTNGAIE